jgi:predicted protein tyrosine phosphatase
VIFKGNQYEHYGSTLCTLELLEWADKVFVMEPMHVERISNYAGENYLEKGEILNIDDTYQYMQSELIKTIERHENIIFG